MRAKILEKEELHLVRQVEQENLLFPGRVILQLKKEEENEEREHFESVTPVQAVYTSQH